MLIPCRHWQLTSERAELLIAVSRWFPNMKGLSPLGDRGTGGDIGSSFSMIVLLSMSMSSFRAVGRSTGVPRS